jgi:hypothetical protein
MKVKFIKVEGEKMFINTLTGRGNSSAIYAEKDGKKGCLPGESNPYMPLGGRKAILEVLDILIWI